MLAQAGAEVIVASRNGAHSTDTKGMIVEKVDVLNRDELAALFEKYATFDFLVNSATGGPWAMGPFLEMDLDGFQGSFAKLWGYINSVKLGTPHLTEKGAIVLVSGYPARKCKLGSIALSAVGNAVEGFVRGVAPELAPRRINVVSPGLIDTPMFTAQGEERNKFFEQGSDGHLIPRAGKAIEVAKGIIFVLENEFITGTTVDVDGGALLS